MIVCKPTYLIDGDITDIDLALLAQDGVRGIILDLDSTLLAPRSGVLTEPCADWLRRAQDSFKVAVVSNNKNERYLDQVRKIIDIPILGRAAKPSRRGFLKMLETFELKAHEVVVVGDRPLTDVWGGQRAGMKTILVWPLKSMNEPSWVTFVRKLERCFIRP